MNYEGSRVSDIHIYLGVLGTELTTNSHSSLHHSW